MSSSSAVICYMWMVLDAYNGVSRGHPAYQRSMGAGGDAAERAARLYTYLGNVENGKTLWRRQRTRRSTRIAPHSGSSWRERAEGLRLRVAGMVLRPGQL